jgi:NADP-dependent 3-hydroxy acid dehydrogenase YdfG
MGRWISGLVGHRPESFTSANTGRLKGSEGFLASTRFSSSAGEEHEMDLSRKTAIVTGASKGIGRSIALALAHAGSKVMLAARSKTDLDRVSQEIRLTGGESSTVVTNMREEKSICEMVATTVKEFGGIDILINNAGLGYFKPAAQIATSEWDEMFEVNLRGVFIATREALPHLRKQKESFIVNLASLAGKNQFVNGSGYAATKWGLIGFSKCLMLEERANGVRVLVVCPGSVDTGFGHPGSGLPKSPAKEIIKPEDVAETIVMALKMPQRTMVSEIDIRPTNP